MIFKKGEIMKKEYFLGIMGVLVLLAMALVYAASLNGVTVVFNSPDNGTYTTNTTPGFNVTVTGLHPN